MSYEDMRLYELIQLAKKGNTKAIFEIILTDCCILKNSRIILEFF